MTDESKALIPQVVSVSTMKPSVTFAQVQEAKKLRDELIKTGLQKDTDFGVIPGTKKNTLYLAGAQQVCSWFECYPEYEILSEEHDPTHENKYKGYEWRWDSAKRKNVRSPGKTEQISYGLHAFRMHCTLIHRHSGMKVGTGVGAASTLEDKFVSRPNDCENTVLKMAKKRSFVDAVLTTFAISDRFTQDVEDLPSEAVDTSPEYTQRPEPHGEDDVYPTTKPTKFGEAKPDTFWVFHQTNGAKCIGVNQGTHLNATFLKNLGFEPGKATKTKWYAPFDDEKVTMLQTTVQGSEAA